MEKQISVETKTSINFIQLFLTLCMLFAISSILTSSNNYGSERASSPLLYEIGHDVYSQVYAMMRSFNCSQPTFSTNLEVLQRHPELIETYETSMSNWLEYYSIDPNSLLAQAIDDALFREMFESGDWFLCIVDGFDMSEFKARKGDSVQRTMNDASVGLADQKAYRMTTGVWSILPEDLRESLALTMDGQHVNPDSLADFLNGGTVAQRMDRSILLAVASGAYVYPEALKIAQDQDVDDWDFRQILSYIICCSGPVEADPEGRGEYGWQILKNYQQGGNDYMNNPDAYNQFDRRGLEHLRNEVGSATPSK